MNIDVLGIDIAKNTFQLHGVDHAGNVMLRKRLARAKLTAYIANLPICTIVMEACGGANYWARTFMQLGHKVKLISQQFVKPFVKTNKNDANVAIVRFVQPSALVPSIITHALVTESRLAQQMAVSRVDADVSLIVDRSGADWRFRISTDVDGLVRTKLFDAENTTLQASSGAVSEPIDSATALLITFSHAGDVADVQIGASSGDASVGIDLQLSGDSARQACIYPTGYATDEACS